MNPRKKESKKWSAIPSELAKQIKAVFEESFSAHLTGKSLKVEGRIYPTELLMRIGINTKGELRFQNFEVSIDHNPTTQDTIQKITVAVDALASLMVDYFDKEENNEMPLTWHEYPFDNEKLWLQFSSTNSDIEQQANKLLGIDEENALLVETLEDMEELQIPEEDEIPEDEDIDTSKPKIFRVPTDNPKDTVKKKKKSEMH
ncbi:MAG: hypothetical protein AABY53_09805 [Bdellovibrionota bacterium]